MHICHLTVNSIDLERRILNQVKSACLNDYQVTIYAHGRRAEAVTENRAGYTLRRLKTDPFQNGPLKFLIFNLKLIGVLLRRSWTIVHCHDLWTLPGAAFVSLFRGYRLIYDAHEYYSGLEIFLNRPIRKSIWILFERLSIYRTDVLLTVSRQLGELYKKKYPGLNRIEIIRNLPFYEKIGQPQKKKFSQHIVFLGHFKPGRGLEILFEALKKTESIHLTLIGGGELLSRLRQLQKEYHLQDRVHFKSYVSVTDLLKITAQYDVGVVLFQPTSLNYAYALPNKFFEYLMAGLPVLASNIDTLKDYVSKYDVGITVDPLDVNSVVSGIKEIFAENSRLKHWQKNARNAALELNWERESVKLLKIYEEIVY